MKKTLLVAAMAALCGFSVIPSASAQGIPVIDAAGVAQAISQGIQLAEQIQQLKNQLDQARAMFDSMNGARGMAQLLNNPIARQYLPKTAGDLYQLANGGGGFSSLSEAIRTAKIAGRIIKSDELSSAGAKAALEKAQTQIASAQATVEAAFDAAGQRFDTLQALVSQIDSATDPKAIADLQARTQAEQVMMQNEMAKLTMLDQIRRVQADLAKQQNKEQAAKMGRGTAVYITPD